MLREEEETTRMEYQFHVVLKRVRRPRASELPPGDPRLHPLVHTLILAHRFKAMVQAGKGHAQIGLEVGLDSSRISGISRMLLLSPKIQEAILTANPERLTALTVHHVRRIALIPDWDEQAAHWTKL